MSVTFAPKRFWCEARLWNLQSAEREASFTARSKNSHYSPPQQSVKIQMQEIPKFRRPKGINRHKKVIDRPRVFCYIFGLSVPPQEFRIIGPEILTTRVSEAFMLIKGACRETAS